MRIKGRKEFIPYALFEAFKARDERLELMPHYSYYPEFLRGIALCSRNLNMELPIGMQFLSSHFLYFLRNGTSTHSNLNKPITKESFG